MPVTFSLAFEGHHPGTRDQQNDGQISGLRLVMQGNASCKKALLVEGPLRAPESSKVHQGPEIDRDKRAA